MSPVQCTLQHASSSSLYGQALSHAPARMVPHARRSLRVQAAVQPDIVESVKTIAVSTINSGFWTMMMGGAYGAFSALSQPGEKKTERVLQEASINASGSMRVGALMGLSTGTLVNLGLQGQTASIGGVALGLGLYAALVTAMNTPNKK